MSKENCIHCQKTTMPCQDCGETHCIGCLCPAKKPVTAEASENERLRMKIEIMQETNQTSKPSGGIGGVLSFIFPGLGQVYMGKAGEGIAWFTFVIFGYCMFIIPGIILHIICIVSATSMGKPKTQVRLTPATALTGRAKAKLLALIIPASFLVIFVLSELIVKFDI